MVDVIGCHSNAGLADERKKSNTVFHFREALQVQFKIGFRWLNALFYEHCITGCCEHLIIMDVCVLIAHRCGVSVQARGKAIISTIVTSFLVTKRTQNLLPTFIISHTLMTLSESCGLYVGSSLRWWEAGG